MPEEIRMKSNPTKVAIELEKAIADFQEALDRRFRINLEYGKFMFEVAEAISEACCEKLPDSKKEYINAIY